MTLESVRKIFNKHKESGDLHTVVYNVKQDLLNYYSTEEGLAELRNSPHSHLPPKAAVELLMQDVRVMAYKELK